MSNDEIFRRAPSIFATEAWSEVSDKYRFIPTLQVVEKMREEGFFPVRVEQSNTRIEGKSSFTKHMIRFRGAQHLTTGSMSLNQEFPEIVLVNSHDRSSGYQLSAGVFRLVCLNGMVVKSSDFGSINVRHSGRVLDDVIEGSFKIVEDMPQIMERVEGFKAISLNPHERQGFAAAAMQLRYPTDDAGNDTSPIAAEKLLRVRRHVDLNKSDLWTTFNAVQENFIKGGLSGRGTTGKRTTTRAIKGVSEDVRLNKALWVLADAMRQHKAAA
jgi:hypothetical protein